MGAVVEPDAEDLGRPRDRYHQAHIIGGNQGLGACAGHRLGDPLKRVDWNATARVGRLQSKLYEPSRTQATVIALNITTMERTWQGFDPVLLERGVSIAASLAQQVFDSGSALGLIANGSFPDAELRTTLLSIPTDHPDAFLARLRRHDPPVIARADQECVLLDPRTIQDGEEEDVVAAVVAAQGESRTV